MTGLALVVLTVIGCGLIVIALTTPGWLSFETNDNVSVSMGLFYCRLCEGVESNELCETMSNGICISSVAPSYSTAFRHEGWMAEASLSFICIAIGGILAVIFGFSIWKIQHGIGESSTGVTVTGLVFSILGWIGGAVLVVELFFAQLRLDNKNMSSSTFSERKEVPYSLIIMCIGLFIEFFAVIVNMASMRTTYREMPVNGMELSPSTNGPSTAVVQQSTTSSTPYARFD